MLFRYEDVLSVMFRYNLSYSDHMRTNSELICTVQSMRSESRVSHASNVQSIPKSELNEKHGVSVVIWMTWKSFFTVVS